MDKRDDWVFLHYIVRIGNLNCPNGQVYDVDSGTCESASKKNIGFEESESCPTGKGGGPFEGNPINVATGNKTQTEIDLPPNANSPLNFKRFYNSHERVGATAMGNKWIGSYMHAIVSEGELETTSLVHFRSERGRELKFILKNNGIWTPHEDVFDRLERLTGAQGGYAGWRLTHASGEVKIFNQFGSPTQLIDINGNSQYLSYDGWGRLTSVEDHFGRSINFTYNQRHLINTMTDISGGLYTYAYDMFGNLISVTYPDNSQRQYLYENTSFPSALTGIIDENGNRYATWAYDELGRAVLSEHAGGVDKTTVTYNNGGTVDVTDALGNQRAHNFYPVHGVAKTTGLSKPCSDGTNAAHKISYGDLGKVNLVTDFRGFVTDYDHDPVRGLEIKRIEAKGKKTERITHTEWHPDYALKTCIIEPKRTTMLDYDERGLLLRRAQIDTSDAALFPGAASKKCAAIKARADQDSLNSRIWTYTYNSNAQVTTIDGPRTDLLDVTAFDYNDLNGDLLTVTNALGQTSRIEQHDAAGRPVRIREASGQVTDIDYDPRGRVTRLAVSADGLARTTLMRYDAVGQLTRVTRTDGSRIDYVYDAAQRLTTIRDQHGNSIHYTLDLKGNTTKTDVYSADGSLSATREQQYNQLNQLVKEIGAAGQTTTYSDYDPNDNPGRITDARGNNTVYYYDALNRLVRATSAIGTDTRYAYDAQDNLTQVIDPRGNATVYRYDGLGNQLQLTSPDTGITTYQYDAAGNMTAKTDNKGQTSTYQYDALNRLTLITYADGSTTQYTYDAATGRLNAVTTDHDSVEYSYNGFGDITQVSRSYNGTTLTTGYQYNSLGQLVTHTYPSGTQIGYRYSQGRVSEITINGQAMIYQIGYQPFGPANRWTWGNGTPYVRSFDLDGQITTFNLNGSTQQLSYDAVGNIIQKGASQYSYDKLNRLIAETGAENQSFTYDANGNRKSKVSDSENVTYLNHRYSNRLLQVGSAKYQYDANGNIIHDGEHSYTYDAKNRLVALNENEARYVHNGLGQRIAKIAQGVSIPGDANGDGIINPADIDAASDHILQLSQSTGNADCNLDGSVNVADLICINDVIAGRAPVSEAGQSTAASLFAYDLGGQLIGEYNRQGNPAQEIVYFGNMPIATVKQGNVYYIYTDHLNTPRLIADTTNRAVWSWESDAFGEAAANDDLDGDGERFEFNLRFPGQYYDQETGLHHNYFRDYDPATGRYIQSDPIGLAGGLNTYAYTYNNPINWSDPLGLKVLNPNGYPVSQEVMDSLREFNKKIGCDKDVVITGGNRQPSSKLGAQNRSTHVRDIAADIHVPGQTHIVTANQAARSGLFGGIGWYEEGYRGPNGEGPHVHVDLRDNGPARWGHPAEGEAMHGYFPNVEVQMNSSSSDCGCE